MVRTKRRLTLILLSVLTALLMCIGVAFTMPTRVAKAETLSTSGWSLAREGDNMFRVQNGNTYWGTYTNNVTTASMLDYAEINGKTLSAINAEKPGSVNVTLQPAGGAIGSFFRVNINTDIAGFTVNDIGTFVIRAGWSHTDANATYTIDTDLYFSHRQNAWPSDNNNWKYIPASNVVDISDDIQLVDQGIQATNTRAILIKAPGKNYWTADPITPNEGNATFLNMLYINGTSIKEWNNKAHAALNAGEITDISYGSGYWLINNGPSYAPIAVSNSNYSADYGSHSQVWIPTNYIPYVSAFKVAKGFAHLQGDTLYYVSKDLEFVKSGSSFVKIASSVDISNAFKFLAQDYTSSDGTKLYYLHTDNVQYWTAQYDTTGAFAINEKEWKGQADVSLQGGAIQMSYIEFNGTPVYDINAKDNGAYGATQGNIASGGKYAPILAFLTPQEMGNSIKLQVPSAYPSGSAGSEHKSIAIKKGFYVVDTSTNIKYEVTRDIQWDCENGVWSEHVEKINATVEDVQMFTGGDGSKFAGIKIAGSDYASAPGTYAGTAKTAVSFAKNPNFYTKILVDGVTMKQPGEAFLNVWGNYGYFTFRPGNNDATEITVLAGCQIPTYDALLLGTNEVYVTTEDVTYIKGSDGTWVKKPDKLQAGEYDTSIQSVVYARDDANNWMMFTLGKKDYPKVSEAINIATVEAKISALNLYDKIVVDGYTLRARIATHGKLTEAPKINLWEADCFAIRIPGCAGALDGAQRVTIKAGAQFPSYVYATEGVEAYYVLPEDVTFVNVGNRNGAWAQQYKITYVVDGEVIGESTYVHDSGETPTDPEVPEKAGYRGAWESYTVGSAANITVNAVYTKKPTSLGTTSIKRLRRMDNGGNEETKNIFVIEPTNSDYPASVEGSWNIGLDVSHLAQFNLFDYITINGKTLREIGVTAAAINKYTRPGLGLNTTLSNSMTVVIKEGCEIPSYQFWQNPTDASKYSCYTVDATYTCVYAAAGEDVFVITKEVSENTDEALFKDHYVLSDLQQDGYVKTDVFKDGYETFSNTGGSEADYRYGYIGSTSFTLSFDFKFSSANYYEVLHINLGTEGADKFGGNKFHFGWRIYLKRGSDSNGTTPDQCVEYFSNTRDGVYYDSNGVLQGSNIANVTCGSEAFKLNTVYNVTIGYKLVNASTGEVMVYTSINGDSRINTYVLGGNFVNFAPYINSLTMNTTTAGTVTVADPGFNMAAKPSKLTLDGIGEIYNNTIYLPDVNPVDYNMDNCVFVGWSDVADLSTLTSENLYAVGAMMRLKSDKTLYPVWLEFNMESGAAVRATVGSSGLRYTVNVDKDIYEAWKTAGIIVEVGSILAPTDYLADTELTHDLGSGRYIQNVTEKWQVENAVYTSAFTNINYDQYGRQFSARGYLKIQFKSGQLYVYTTYNAGDHSRSIYDVATAAYKDGYADNTVVKSYVNDVADLVIDSDLIASKNTNAVGSYTVDSAKGDNNTLTITISNGNVKAAIINGTRIVMGKQASVMIGSVRCLISGYKLNNDGLQLTFTVEQKEDFGKDYYIDLLQKYSDSTVYTKTHKAYVDSVVKEAISAMEASGSSVVWATKYAETDTLLKTVKTAVELAANDTSDVRLATPTLSKGLGYTVTWNEVAGADYYTVSDDNDYRTERVVLAGKNTYKAEVIGDHNVKVTAHSYFDSLNSSFESSQVATTKVKPVFSYKSMLDGLYKFNKSQMETVVGVKNPSTDVWRYDSSDKKYFAYYNTEIGWTPNETMATDWTSPEEFPAHAQRLKDMGNNVILIAFDTKASYKADETWASSRMKYVMDTAWTMGMKVLVCDEVFYRLSMSDSDWKDSWATSVAQVTTAINNRNGFADYVTHPAFYGFSLDDEPYADCLDAMRFTITALDAACAGLGVENPFYLACLFQSSGSDDVYTGNTLLNYYKDWLSIPGVDHQYLYVDIYTQHAMDYPFYWLTNRYENSFDAVYSGLSDVRATYKFEFYQAITSHTQNSGTLSEKDLYMSLLYAAAHDVAGYAWFCYFPISGETAASMVGYDGNGYGNGIGNKVEKTGKSFYNAAKTAGYQFELIQGLLDGYDWESRKVSGDLLTTTLSNGTKTATMYVNADEDNMSNSVEVTVSGECYLVGWNVGTAEVPYQTASGKVTLQPGQAVICMG